ncbi:MAG: HEAT repeat domain-containing protein [Rhodothermaceae bacterium]|nr:HEAT repeat domain-containing protein [Rhodothermaceae bacterium]
MLRSFTGPVLSVAGLAILILLTGFQKRNPELPDLKITIWAKQPFLKNPVAISHDRQGRLYVSEANRRKSTDLDVRNMKGLEPIPWPALDYSLESVEQRRELLKEYLDPANGIVHSWMKDYNDDGIKNWVDLQAKTERINLLEDTDGDGAADKASVFAENFNTEVTGTAGGVLWFNDNVYFTAIPDLWLLNDDDDDGVADRREVLVTGHGVHIGQGGHDLHGLTVGPDGRLYWSVGDKGINITSKEGKHFFYPNQGVVMRSEPDGSNFEVFAHGLRNCQELSFDTYGNLFCVDNDGDFKGERERLVYVTQHSDTGWRINWQYNHTNQWASEQKLPAYNPWMDEGLSIPHFDEQAAYITPTLQNYSDGPAGFIRNPGTALSAEYKNHYFLTQFPGKRITSFELAPSGASFKMINESTFHEGFMATGLSFAPDGSLFIADWAGNWEPTEEGGIVRVDVEDAKQHPLRDSTQKLIETGMDNRSIDQLVELLAYPDQRVRLDAQFELVTRNELAQLIFVAQNSTNRLARVHSMWGIGQLIRSNLDATPFSIAELLGDIDPQIRIQACRLVLEAPHLFKDRERQLVYLIQGKNQQVRFHALMALAKMGTDFSLQAITNLIIDNNNTDPFIRHAAATALAGIGNVSALTNMAKHPERAVRRTAVVALRRLQNRVVSTFLNDADGLVALEAARAIHDDYGIQEAMPLLAALLNETPHLDSEGLLRRALNANLRLGGAQSLERVLQFASNDSNPANLRQEALDIVYTWKNPPVLDRVERRYRVIPERDVKPLAPIIESHLPALLASNSSELNRAVFDIVDAYNINLDPELLSNILSDESRPAIERIEALQLLAPQKRQAKKAFARAFDSPNDSLRAEAMALAMQLDKKRGLSRINSVLDKSTSIAEQQRAFSLLARENSSASAKTLQPWVSKLADGTLDPSIQLDVYTAAEMNDLLPENYEASTDAAMALTLYGGNAKQGAEIFQNHPAAQCIRCHAINEGEGSNVGPNLQGIGSKVDRAYLLESLIQPSMTMAEGFPGQMSSMPPMGIVLEPQEIRDVIEYLSTL